MSAFETLLDEIGSSAQRGRVSQKSLDSSPGFHSHNPATGNSANAYLRYAQDESEPPPQIDALHAQFLIEIETARRSISQLKTLRRKIAWRLHPDRRATDQKRSEAAMAELNALIDATLVALKNKINVPR